MTTKKVESVLKIDGQEVKEVGEIELLRFYLSNDHITLYIANPKGDVIASVDADSGQNMGYISEIKNMVTNETVHGE